MNSYLIIGTYLKNIIKKINEIAADFNFPEISLEKQNPDLLLIKAFPSIKISQIRQAEKFLSFKPFQEKIKIVFLLEADKLTIPAQNAFLKTLEEPPQNSLIILVSSNENRLLETIISRCQIIKLKEKSKVLKQQNLQINKDFLNQLLKSKVGKRLNLIQPFCQNKEKALDFCLQTITFLKSKNIIQYASIIKKISKTIQLLEANVNVRLALNNLAIRMADD